MAKNIIAACVIAIVLVVGGIALHWVDTGQGNRSADIKGKNVSGYMASD